jgi:hypothetical protein
MAGLLLCAADVGRLLRLDGFSTPGEDEMYDTLPHQSVEDSIWVEVPLFRPDTGSLRAQLKDAVSWNSGKVRGPKNVIRHCDDELHAYVLKFGKFYEGRPLPDKYERGRRGNCFCDATMMTVHNDGLRYVEGFAFHLNLGPHFLMHHAWCLDRDNRVVDPTWGCGLAYYGVAFDDIFACRLVGRVPNAMGLTAQAWAECQGKLPAPPANGPSKPLPLIRAAKAGWRATNIGPIGVLPNGSGQFVVFCTEKAIYTPVTMAIVEAGMTIATNLKERGIKGWCPWAVEVLCEKPNALRLLDNIVWKTWLAQQGTTLKGIHPTPTLLRVLSYKAIAAVWPPRKKGQEIPAQG